ncbi:DNA-3-methyladenine glycosylase [Furfurilactobacillus entadae]|uniref:DNA-3-methyladenine glycosylase n=1 Tax=Furfurilactobacillus entadae TaxID=2922307 RepID=UPI0035ED4FEE
MELASFLGKRVTTVNARALLGCEVIYHGRQGPVGGLIVETEAYLGDADSAAHAFKHRRSQANRALYNEPGTLYFYTMRGLILMNFVCQPAGTPQGILIRGLQPTVGEDHMQQNRSQRGYGVTNGPAKLTAALGITDRRWNDIAFAESPFEFHEAVRTPQQVIASPRIGVSAGDWQNEPLRFYVSGNPYVSAMRKRDMDEQTGGWTTGI